jgi:hypothetical protein
MDGKNERSAEVEGVGKGQSRICVSIPSTDAEHIINMEQNVIAVSRACALLAGSFMPPVSFIKANALLRTQDMHRFE